MITQHGVIIDIERQGAIVTVEIPLVIGHTVFLHPGPVKLIQDGDQQRLNRSMYVALKTIKDAYVSGVSPGDVRDLMKLAADTITAIEKDEDLMKQVSN